MGIFQVRVYEVWQGNFPVSFPERWKKGLQWVETYLEAEWSIKFDTLVYFWTWKNIYHTIKNYIKNYLF